MWDFHGNENANCRLPNYDSLQSGRWFERSTDKRRDFWYREFGFNKMRVISWLAERLSAPNAPKTWHVAVVEPTKSPPLPIFIFAHMWIARGLVWAELQIRHVIFSLPYSLELSPWGANSRSAGQKSFHLLQNPKFHYSVHKSMTFFNILSEMNQVHVFALYSFKPISIVLPLEVFTL
jgi:hypothetical protein